MQGGKGKVERRLISFSLSGVASLGRVRDMLANINTQHHFSLQARGANSPLPTTILFRKSTPLQTPKCTLFSQAQLEIHDTAAHLFAKYKLWEQ